MTDYSEHCPDESKDAFNAMINLLVNQHKQEIAKPKNPILEPALVNKELARLRKALDGLSKYTLSVLHGRIFSLSLKSGNSWDQADKSASQFSKYLSDIPVEKYTRLHRQDALLRLNFGGSIAAEYRDHGGEVTATEKSEFAALLETVIEDTGADYDAGRLARDVVKAFHYSL